MGNLRITTALTHVGGHRLGFEMRAALTLPLLRDFFLGYGHRSFSLVLESPQGIPSGIGLPLVAVAILVIEVHATARAKASTVVPALRVRRNRQYQLFPQRRAEININFRWIDQPDLSIVFSKVVGW